MSHLRNPIPDNQWGEWIRGMEPRLEEVIKRSTAVDDALKHLGNDTASSKVRTAFAQVNGRLFAMRSGFNSILNAESYELLGERPADVVAMDVHGNVKTTWRAAYIGALPQISFADLLPMRRALDEAGTIFDRAVSRVDGDTASGVLRALRSDMDAISGAIFDLAEESTAKYNDEDTEREDVDAILMDVYSGDLEGYALEIYSIAERRIAENDRQADLRKAKQTDNDDALIALCERGVAAIAEYNSILTAGDETTAQAFSDETLDPLMIQIGDMPAKTLEGHAAKAKVFNHDHIDCSGGAAHEAKEKFLSDLANLAPVSRAQTGPLKEAA